MMQRGRAPSRPGREGTFRKDKSRALKQRRAGCVGGKQASVARSELTRRQAQEDNQGGPLNATLSSVGNHSGYGLPFYSRTIKGINIKRV